MVSLNRGWHLSHEQGQNRGMLYHENNVGWGRASGIEFNNIPLPSCVALSRFLHLSGPVCLFPRC